MTFFRFRGILYQETLQMLELTCMFSRTLNPVATNTQSYLMRMFSKPMQIKPTVKKVVLGFLLIVLNHDSYNWLIFFRNNVHGVNIIVVAKSSMNLPYLGDIENPGQLQDQEILWDTDDCVSWIIIVSSLFVLWGRGISLGMPVYMLGWRVCNENVHYPYIHDYELTYRELWHHNCWMFIVFCPHISNVMLRLKFRDVPTR